MNDCKFCNLERDRTLKEGQSTKLFLDNYPVTKGHALIIPKSHVSTPQGLLDSEILEIFDLMRKYCQEAQDLDKTILGFNIGFNDGEAAGQTIFHAHMHVIPRRLGDVEVPRGGIRNIIPGKGSY